MQAQATYKALALGSESGTPNETPSASALLTPGNEGPELELVLDPNPNPPPPPPAPNPPPPKLWVMVVGGTANSTRRTGITPCHPHHSTLKFRANSHGSAEQAVGVETCFFWSANTAVTFTSCGIDDGRLFAAYRSMWNTARPALVSASVRITSWCQSEPVGLRRFTCHTVVVLCAPTARPTTDQAYQAMTHARERGGSGRGGDGGGAGAAHILVIAVAEIAGVDAWVDDSAAAARRAYTVLRTTGANHLILLHLVHRFGGAKHLHFAHGALALAHTQRIERTDRF